MSRSELTSKKNRIIILSNLFKILNREKSMTVDLKQ